MWGLDQSLPKDAILASELEDIVSWRRDFLRSHTKESLLRFSDSIESLFTEYSYTYPIHQSKELKEQLRASFDSSTFYGLLYFTLLGEEDLLRTKAMSLGATNMRLWIDSHLDKERYQSFDTVFLVIDTKPFSYRDPDFDFSRLSCVNTQTGERLKPKIVKAGPNYVLMYKPASVGAHEVTGSISYEWEKHLRSNFQVQHQFTVR